MHFHFLIEDKSGKKMLEHLVPKIIDADQNTFEVNSYEGIGHLPKKMTNPKTLKQQSLLNDLQRILKGLGKTFAGYDSSYPACVIVVCDLDDRCLAEFRTELIHILTLCNPKPETRFCIAIEEGEAWLLGDQKAIRTAYPKVKKAILDRYTYDSICGTWEVLKEAIGNSKKTEWADKITPYIDIEANQSESFQYFVSKVRELATNS